MSFWATQDGHCGGNPLCVGGCDHYSVVVVQRPGAGLLSVQPGDPQAGAGSLQPEPHLLQLVADGVQHAAHSGGTRQQRAAGRRRLLPHRGLPGDLPVHQLDAEHGSAEHRQVDRGGLPAEVPLQDAPQGRGVRPRLHVGALHVLLHGGRLPLLGGVPPAVRVLHPVQPQGEQPDPVRHLHRLFPLVHLPAVLYSVVCDIPQSAESGEVPLQEDRRYHNANFSAAGGHTPQVSCSTPSFPLCVHKTPLTIDPIAACHMDWKSL